MPHQAVVLTKDIYLNFLRPHDFSRRARQELEAKIDRYEKALRLFPDSPEARGLPREEVDAACRTLQDIINHLYLVLEEGRWE